MTQSSIEISLAGKAALITGAARGLGAEMAHTFARAGASVIITDILEKEGQATAAEINNSGGTAVFIRHDVTSESDWENVVASAVKQLGGLDIVVNNAGIEICSLFENTTLEDFQRILDINVNGVFLGLKHACKAMKPGGIAGKGGSIINLSSVAGLRGYSGLSAYCGSKGAVKLLTKAAAVEFGQLQYGIRVNSIHPGLIPTNMGEAVLKGFVDLGLGADEAAVQQAFERGTPLGMKGEPADIAKAALFLASDQSPWVTGAEIVVDGGSTAC
ncbi:MAG: glucose 1-dehydrogenase [Porticoccaceae bacterium]|nr:glucose 1-dehydrogenase [Porticoccaceae bacterium]